VDEPLNLLSFLPQLLADGVSTTAVPQAVDDELAGVTFLFLDVFVPTSKSLRSNACVDVLPRLQKLQPRLVPCKRHRQAPFDLRPVRREEDVVLVVGDVDLPQLRGDVLPVRIPAVQAASGRFGAAN